RIADIRSPMRSYNWLITGLLRTVGGLFSSPVKDSIFLCQNQRTPSMGREVFLVGTSYAMSSRADLSQWTCITLMSMAVQASLDGMLYGISLNVIQSVCEMRVLGGSVSNCLNPCARIAISKAKRDSATFMGV